MKSKVNKWLVFLVSEGGRGQGLVNRNLEMTDVSRRGGKRWRRQESGWEMLWKNDLDRLCRLSSKEFKPATNRIDEYGKPRVKLKIMCIRPVTDRTRNLLTLFTYMLLTYYDIYVMSWPVAYLGGPLCEGPPFGRTAVIFLKTNFHA